VGFLIFVKRIQRGEPTEPGNVLEQTGGGVLPARTGAVPKASTKKHNGDDFGNCLSSSCFSPLVLDCTSSAEA
jgi:hypothetical protein